MDDETRARFDAVEKEIASTEKRFDDLKWYIGGAAGLFAVGFSVLTIVLSWNYSGVWDELRYFEQGIKVDLGKVEAQPDLDILGPNRRPLAGQELDAGFSTGTDGMVRVDIDGIIQNKGDGSTGPVNIKIYAKDLRLESPSSDEPAYTFEALIVPKNLDPNDFPGKISQHFYLHVVVGKQIPPKGQYKCLMKIYYGKGKVASAPFTLVAG